MDDQAYTDEINLYDYLKIIYKWKLLIAALCLTSIVLTLTLTLTYKQGPSFKVSALISLGRLDEKGEGRSIQAANIIAAVTTGGFNERVYQALNLDPKKISLNFTVTQPKNPTTNTFSNTLQIDYFTPNPEQGKSILNELLKQLQDVYGERAQLEQQRIDNSIEVIKNQIKTIANQKELLLNQKNTINNQKKRMAGDSETIVNSKKKTISDIESERRRIELLKESEKTIKRQIEEVENNTKMMMEQRAELLKPEGAKMDAGTKILYLNSIQQNIIYLDRLNAQIDKNKMDQEGAKNNIEKLEIKLNDLDVDLKKQDINLKDKDTELMNLETNLRDKDNEIMNQIEKKADVELSKKTSEGTLYILQPAVSSLNTTHVFSKKKVAAAGIASLFIGIMLAFFIEYIKKMQRVAR